MEAGEKEIRKAFEDVTTNNVKATVTHSNETRRLLRVAEEKVVSLDGLVRQQQQDIAAIRQQLSTIQAIVFRGGTSDV